MSGWDLRENVLLQDFLPVLTCQREHSGVYHPLPKDHSNPCKSGKEKFGDWMNPHPSHRAGQADDPFTSACLQSGMAHPIKYVTVTVAVTVMSPASIGVEAPPPTDSAIA